MINEKNIDKDQLAEIVACNKMDTKYMSKAGVVIKCPKEAIIQKKLIVSSAIQKTESSDASKILQSRSHSIEINRN